MALGSRRLTPGLINQSLPQPRVIACALNFNGLLYEVRFCVCVCVCEQVESLH